jgi:hypothetical protein
MTGFSDATLYRRGMATLAASWETYARGTPAAAVQRGPGVVAAVFPRQPERAVYNNALLERDLAAAARLAAIESMESTYAAAGITRFAAWVHESDTAMGIDLERRGYALVTSTRAMGMALGSVGLPPPRIELGEPDWRQ